jgi:hypothetical protein
MAHEKMMKQQSQRSESGSESGSQAVLSNCDSDSDPDGLCFALFSKHPLMPGGRPSA